MIWKGDESNVEASGKHRSYRWKVDAFAGKSLSVGTPWGAWARDAIQHLTYMKLKLMGHVISCYVDLWRWGLPFTCVLIGFVTAVLYWILRFYSLGVQRFLTPSFHPPNLTYSPDMVRVVISHWATIEIKQQISALWMLCDCIYGYRCLLTYLVSLFVWVTLFIVLFRAFLNIIG